MPKPLRPGDLLAEKLLTAKVSWGEFALHINEDHAFVSAFIENKIPCTLYIATKLGAAFDTSPHFWLQAQNHHDHERLSKITLPSSLRTRAAKQKPPEQ